MREAVSDLAAATLRYNERVMGVYDDVKTAVERLITPDLGEIKARLTAVEKKIDEVDQRSEGRDQEIIRVMERGDQDILRQMERGDQEILRQMERGFDRVTERVDALSRQLRTEDEVRDLAQRLAALESKLRDRGPQQASQ